MVHGIREAPSCPIWGNDSDFSTSATEYSDEDSDTSNDPGETMPTRFANMIVPFSEQLAGEAGRSATVLNDFKHVAMELRARPR